MPFTIKDIAGRIAARLEGGDPEALISGVAPLKDAGSGDISFLSNPKYLGEAKATRAGAVIVQKALPDVRAAQLVTDNPYLAWARVMTLFAPDRSSFLPRGVHPSAVVSPSASLGKNVAVGANVFIGDETTVGDNTRLHPGVVVEDHCAIGGDCEIHPNTVIHYGTLIGSRVVIWSGAVIGSYGFGFAPDGDKFVTIPQLGHVVLEDDVRVGAGTAIDRGAAGPTRVKQGTKIDNLVHIAHNVQIGRNCAVTAQVGISGSTVIGDRVKIGGQAGFVGHIEIGDDSFVGAQAGVSRSFPAKSTLSGYPARDLMDVRRSDVIVGRLPEIAKRLDALERKLKAEGK